MRLRAVQTMLQYLGVLTQQAVSPAAHTRGTAAKPETAGSSQHTSHEASGRVPMKDAQGNDHLRQLVAQRALFELCGLARALQQEYEACMGQLQVLLLHLIKVCCCIAPSLHQLVLPSVGSAITTAVSLHGVRWRPPRVPCRIVFAADQVG